MKKLLLALALVYSFAACASGPKYAVGSEYVLVAGFIPVPFIIDSYENGVYKTTAYVLGLPSVKLTPKKEFEEELNRLLKDGTVVTVEEFIRRTEEEEKAAETGASNP